MITNRDVGRPPKTPLRPALRGGFSARLRAPFQMLLVALATFVLALARAADDYVDVDPANIDKSVSAPLFVIIAYSAIWLVVVALTMMLWKRQAALREELRRAETALHELTEGQERD